MIIDLLFSEKRSRFSVEPAFFLYLEYTYFKLSIWSSNTLILIKLPNIYLLLFLVLLQTPEMQLNFLMD